MAELMLVAMSGGVDSSVAAALMREAGVDVVGVFMRNGVHHDVENKGKPNKQGCCSIEDSKDAGAVARSLEIPFYALNFEEDFTQVIDYFVDEYKQGRTPNPCVICNNDLKFGKLFAYADDLGASKVVTGHFARTRHERGRYRLFRGADRSKDQSYYLFGLTQEQLARCQFPLGEMKKTEVREHASRLGLCTSSKPESQEICFVPNNDYRTLIEKHSPEVFRDGPIVDEEGKELGRHRGTPAFTIGQRRGIGIGGGDPLYVTKLQPETNTVVVGGAEQLRSHEAVIEKPHFIGFERPGAGETFEADVQIRYQHKAAPAKLTMLVDGSLHAEFDDGQSAITPGQAAVFHDGDECLGGGWLA